MAAPRTAVYAGSFDPITIGHIDLVRRAAPLYDKIILAVGHNPAKKTLLALSERLEVMRTSVAGLDNVEVDSFEGLLVNYCRKVDAQVILRGLRAVTDFEFEFQFDSEFDLDFDYNPRL